jgi:molybdopterin molybdotransferase
VTPGRFIARRGSDVRAGEVVLEAGVRMGPAQLAVAASVGAHRVRCCAKPRAAVATTGDELVPADREPGAAQIRDSNNLMLTSMLKRMGCDVSELGIIPDDPRQVRDALERALQFDVTFVSGGMSMGEYDYVPRILKELGVDLRITKLRIKPGKPFVFGVLGDKYVFGLPGNPVSGFVCTARLASRLVTRLAGSVVHERWIETALTDPLPANGPREFYQPAIFMEDGRVRPLSWKGSADVFTLSRANALLVRGENEPALSAGARVRVFEI